MKKTIARLTVLSLVLALAPVLFAFGAFAQDGIVVYIDKTATGANNGTSPADAYTSLSTAMSQFKSTGGTLVVCGPTGVVAGATYYNTENTGGTIRITSVYGGVDYRQTNGAVMKLSHRAVLYQNVILEHINVLIGESGTADASTGLYMANVDPLTLIDVGYTTNASNGQIFQVSTTGNSAPDKQVAEAIPGVSIYVNREGVAGIEYAAFVSGSAAGANNGSSPEDAYTSVSDAADALKDVGGTVVVSGPTEIKSSVAASAALPITITSVFAGTDYRGAPYSATLSLAAGVTLPSLITTENVAAPSAPGATSPAETTAASTPSATTAAPGSSAPSTGNETVIIATAALLISAAAVLILTKRRRA